MHKNQLPRRTPTRANGYDYTQPGAYLITVVTRGRRTLFGEIRNGKMRPNPRGDAVLGAWESLAEIWSYVELDAFVVMPNHVHGILRLVDDGSPRRPLGAIVGAFKGRATKAIVPKLLLSPGRLWQHGFHDRILVDEAALERARRYVIFNPEMWDEDGENPNVSGRGAD